MSVPLGAVTVMVTTLSCPAVSVTWWPSVLVSASWGVILMTASVAGADGAMEKYRAGLENEIRAANKRWCHQVVRA